MALNRTACISVDLDAARYYRAIHGLEPAPTESDPVLELAPTRLGKWATELGIPLTWFVVGRDLDRDAFAEQLLGWGRRGHELANHTLDHFYDLTRRDRSVMRQEVLGGSERLTRLTGQLAHGFRAPGYVMTDELQALLVEAGVPYDSSVFPCPLYYAAKSVALFGQRLLDRQSHSIQDSPTLLRAPTEPYRMGPSYETRGDGLLELPIQVVGPLRLPFIGTTLTLLGSMGARLLARVATRDSFINLELHGIDAVDSQDGLEELSRVQPDLRVPWQRKLRTLGAVVELLRGRGFNFITLGQAAERFASAGRTSGER